VVQLCGPKLYLDIQFVPRSKHIGVGYRNESVNAV